MSAKAGEVKRCTVEPTMWTRKAAVAACFALALVVAAVPFPASAETTIPGGTVISDGSGNGPGQLMEPFDIAVDPSNGRLYVADRASQRVDVFGPTGFITAFGWGVADGSSQESQTCTVTCFGGIAGSGPGQLNNARAVAVDGDSSSPSFHDVYVFERNNHRVEKFDSSGTFLLAFGDGVNHTSGGDICTATSGNVCGLGVEGDANGQFGSEAKMAVGSDGKVYVDDSGRVQRFGENGEFELSIPLTANAGPVTGLAIDSGGDIYASSEPVPSGPPAATAEYDSAGTFLKALLAASAVLAIEPSGNLLVSREESERKLISEFDSAGNQIADFAYYRSNDARLVGLAAFESSNGDLYVATPLVSGGNATPRIWRVQKPPPGPLAIEGSTVAPSVKNTSAILQSSFNPEGETTSYEFQYIDQAEYEKDGAGFASPATRTTSVADAPAEFKVVDATAEATDLIPETTYRFRLIAVNSAGEATSETGTFETLAPLGIEEAWSTSVTADSATLNASINPLGISATAYFEYVDAKDFSATEFADAIQVPAVSDGASPINLGDGEAPMEISAGITGLQPGETIHFRVVATDSFASFVGADTIFTTIAPAESQAPCAKDVLRSGLGSDLLDCRAYEMVSPVDKEGSDIVPVPNTNGRPAALDQSSVDGAKLTFSTYRAFGNPEGAPYSNQYMATRGADGWTTSNMSPPRGARILEPAFSIDREFRAFTEDLGYGWLYHDSSPLLAPGAVEGFVNLYRRDSSSGAFQTLTNAMPTGVSPGAYEPELQGIAAGGARAVFRAPAKLTSNANLIAGRFQLYESHDGTLSLVSVLPNGHANPSSASLGGIVSSANLGGRVATVDHAMSMDGSRIYWTAIENAGGAGPGTIYVRVDGSDTVPVSETVTPEPVQFVTASADGSQALFLAKEGEALSLYQFGLASDSSKLIAREVVGVAGAAVDLSSIYFVSQDVLDGGAVTGRENLYVDHDGSISFIATLSFDDTHNHEGNDIALGPQNNLSRASDDGTHLLFMSSASLTGQDSHDAVSGEPDQQVFVYSDSTKVLTCVSCNATGARPDGRQIEGGSTASNSPLWIAGRIPPWVSQMYSGHEISADGKRVFFESFDALVPQDVNSKGDVYEWEEDGVGSCTKAKGCVGLVSSGTGESDSEFVDASASGGDVFFSTAPSLVPQDPGLVDIYDARVNGGFPPPPAPPLPCDGEECQARQNPPTVPDIGSASFSGPGNPTAKGGKKSRCSGKRGAAGKKNAHCGKQHAKHHKRRHHKKRSHDKRLGRHTGGKK